VKDINSLQNNDIYSKRDNLIYSQEFWSGFENFLKRTNNYRSTKDRVNYARLYAHILQKGDARELLELSDDKRIHTMKSLSALAKYTGCYSRWQEIRQSFQLKWSNDNSLQAFSSIFNKEKDLDHMICWLKDTCSRLPQQYANILIFNTLTGLRPSEACMAITLIHNNFEHYLNRDTQTIEHFKFQGFIRRTKKAYISFFNENILKIAENAEKELTYNSLKWIFKRYNIPLCMSFCRKIFATYLRTQGVEQEIIDLLQGRTPRNVFVRHYYRPNFIEEHKKITILLTNLYIKISC
jgi:intergrase/recombinase